MKNQFVTFEIAVEIRNIGFDEKCIAFFNTTHESSLCFCDIFGFANENEDDVYVRNSDGNKITAPLWQQIIDWFREEHDIIVHISSYAKYKHLYQLMGENNRELTEISEWINSYEAARELAILKAIELVNEKK